MVWKCFSNFFLRLDQKPLAWEDRIILFVAYLSDSGKKASTIKSYISAVKAVLQIDGWKINMDAVLIKSLTKACSLRDNKINTRLPVQKGMLNTLLRTTVKHFAEQPYLQQLYLTMFITVYFGLFRVGELTQTPHVVKARDVHIAKNKNKLLFIL